VLVHDAQYTDDEYEPRVGWGHSSVTDAVAFARVSEARQLVLFHHDPLHADDELERLEAHACELWDGHGGEPPMLAREGMELAL
jgi:ribonuclease BN (tRNA processing enzyme)